MTVLKMICDVCYQEKLIFDMQETNSFGYSGLMCKDEKSCMEFYRKTYSRAKDNLRDDTK